MTAPITERERAALAAAERGHRPPAQLPSGLRLNTPTSTVTTSTSTQPAAPPATVEQLLRAAAQSDLAKVRRLGDKIQGLVNELRAELLADNRATAARAKVARLRAELAEAEKALRGLNGGGSTRGARPPGTADMPLAAEIRAWAKAQGIDCPEFGRVPDRVVSSWRETHRGAS